MRKKLDAVERLRCDIARKTDRSFKSELGQFMTPANLARFMASLFPPSSLQTCRLLDAGAGIGALSCAFLERWTSGGFDFESVEATAYEIDKSLGDYLTRHLGGYSRVTPNVIIGDYIEHATHLGLHDRGYTHAILNPPYKKINSQSPHRLALRSVGIEATNLYSAFVALAIGESTAGGHIVAIIPRSFCNGPYFRPFREYVLERTAIRHIHLFESRNTAFSDDNVLQENIIIHLERGGEQRAVTITTSSNSDFSDIRENEHPFDRIVLPDDPQRFIHVPTTAGKCRIEESTVARYSLADINLNISTGPIVDFRVKAHLRQIPESGCVPLIYPAHVSMDETTWPLPSLKKPNAIHCNGETEKWLYPNGFYCVVRRFSSKEEKRRVIASIIDPTTFGEHDRLGIENHLNVFHVNKRGIPEALARGLAVYLNSSFVDDFFRRFNGHTQVNATDLKLMKYPSHEVLVQIGKWARAQGKLTQEQVDAKIGALI